MRQLQKCHVAKRARGGGATSSIRPAVASEEVPKSASSLRDPSSSHTMASGATISLRGMNGQGRGAASFLGHMRAFLGRYWLVTVMLYSWLIGLIAWGVWR